MPEEEAHPIIAEDFYQLFDQACQNGLVNPVEKGPTLALFAVALTTTPGFEEQGLPKSWSEFSKRHPGEAALLRQGAKDLQVPGFGRLNPVIPKECTPRGVTCYILNPIYVHGLALNSVEQRTTASQREPGRMLLMLPVLTSSANKHTAGEKHYIEMNKNQPRPSTEKHNETHTQACPSEKGQSAAKYYPPLVLKIGTPEEAD